MSLDSNYDVGYKILRNYGKFLKEQNEAYNDIILYNDAKHVYPIQVLINHKNVHEDIIIFNIIQSDNKLFKKIIATFTNLITQIQQLQNEAESRFYYFISLYSVNYIESNLSPEEFIGSNIEELHKLNAFVKRCHDVVVNLTRQMSSLNVGDLIDLKNLKLNYIISKLGDMLLVLVKLDHLINASPILNHWATYRRSIKLIHTDPRKYNKTAENLKSMDVILDNIEEKVLKDKIFESCVETLLNFNVKNTKVNKCFIVEEFTSYFKKSLSDMDKIGLETVESSVSIQWTKINALFVFYALVFGNADKKIVKMLLESNLKAHSVPLFGPIIWYPEQFLLRYISFLLKSHTSLLQKVAKLRQNYLIKTKNLLLKDGGVCQKVVTKWAINMNEAFSNNETQLTPIQMNHRMTLLKQSIEYSSQANYIITCFINMHISQGIPITKTSLSSVCKIVDTLKCIEDVFKTHYYAISSSINLIVQHTVYQIVTKIRAAKKTLTTDKTYSKQRLDELTAIVVAERALRGPITIQRWAVINLALSFVPSNIFNDNFYTLLESVDSIIAIQDTQKVNCNCMLLYWNKFLISHYLDQLMKSKKDTMKLPLIVKAINDSMLTVKKSERRDSDGHTTRFFNQMNELFNNVIIKQLGQEIETNLRLHTHTHLKLDLVNPFTAPLDDLKPILKLPHLKIHNYYVSVIHGIEHYLSCTFYNLTTVVLHDWRTYGEMRQLANIKFDLSTVEDNLPTQTLEQGLDVLEIMRNIHTFVSKYLYNLNNQIFIEHTNNSSKSLNTINITHIANSIRTHGTGIMNTTVNFTYQFLRKKFHNFSQFMYDEQIKSRLIKDVRHFREAATDSEQMYSYKRADKFNKAIRNLGLDQDDRSYLDLFRILVTEIGNAMGYVRMVRSGGLHCCANSSAFLPSLEDVWSFDELLHGNMLSVHSTQAIKNLENTINNLISNFFNGTEYFKLFVDVFSPIFRNPDNVHLKSFYIIVPPLTLNFVENILLCKDKLNKKNMSGAGFTDDGFAMGLAYILKLLDQDQGMDSLHWFESVNKHIAQERMNIEDQLAKGASQGHQALALTQKKLNILEQEFQLLYFSFSSARIFFQV